MKDLLHQSALPQIERIGFLKYRLTAEQVFPVGRDEVFAFFENPGNLGEITPSWLRLTLLNGEEKPGVYEGAEFDYSIQWLGIRIAWESRIVTYNPPNDFTDIQVKGPYQSWVHQHTFSSVADGTLMRDCVTYRVPLIAWPLHRHIIKRHLIEIFTFRALKMRGWADGTKKAFRPQADK